MGNTLKVAKKEFTDLVNSRLMIIVLVWFGLFSIGIAYYTYSHNYLNHVNHPSDYFFYVSPVEIFFDGLVNIFRYYGPVLAVVTGFVSMASEVDGRALGTLLTKPLYRDTVINGKLLGNLAFFAVLVLATSVFYGAFVLAMTGNMSTTAGVWGTVPLVLLLCLPCMMFIYSLSVFVTLLIRDQSLALFMSLLSYYVLFELLSFANIVVGIQEYFHSKALGDLVMGLSMDHMYFMLLGSGPDLGSILANNGFEFFKLALFCVVMVTLAYIVFLRRDVA